MGPLPLPAVAGRGAWGRCAPSPCVRGERVSLASSGLPRFLLSDDGVEDGQELSGDGDGGKDLGFSGLDQALAKGAEGRVEAAGDQGGDEEGSPDRAAAAADKASALPGAGLAGPRGEPGEGGDLAAAEGAQLGHLGQQGAGTTGPT